MNATAPKEIEFDCPNCQQSFKSATFSDGMECTCVNCNFQFTILARPSSDADLPRASAPGVAPAPTIFSTMPPFPQPHDPEAPKSTSSKRAELIELAARQIRDVALGMISFCTVVAIVLTVYAGDARDFEHEAALFVLAGFVLCVGIFLFILGRIMARLAYIHAAILRLEK